MQHSIGHDPIHGFGCADFGALQYDSEAALVLNGGKSGPERAALSSATGHDCALRRLLDIKSEKPVLALLVEVWRCRWSLENYSVT